jgi:hypothetical protein
VALLVTQTAQINVRFDRLKSASKDSARDGGSMLLMRGLA